MLLTAAVVGVWLWAQAPTTWALAAQVETSIALRRVKLYDPPGQWGRPFPMSVTLSPDGKRLAVIAGGAERLLPSRSNQWLEVVAVPDGRPLWDFGDCRDVAPRWHPSKPLLIKGDNLADKPWIDLAYVASGRRRKMFRGAIGPFCWGSVGRLTTYGVAAPFASRTLTSRVPWCENATWLVQRLSCGPSDAVAAEILPVKSGFRAVAQYVETYRKVPNRLRWVRAGRIDPKVEGRKVAWYPNNPDFLADGRLVYLRIYPAQWTHSWNSSGRQTRGAPTARNRAEVWVCSLDGSNQRKVVTLWRLRPFIESPNSDWFTIDRAGRTICYLSWDRIRVLRLRKPL